MPQKGSKSPADNENASNHGESGLTSFDEVAAKLSSEFDSKFGRLESALEAKLDAIAAVVPNAGSQHRGEKRPFVPNYEPHDTRSKAARKDSLSQSAGPSRQFNFINPENNMSGQQMSSGASYSADAMDHSLRPQFTASDGSAAMFSSSGNNNMEAWLTERAQTLAANSTALPLSSRDFSSNMTLDSQISQILATTAHQLSTGLRCVCQKGMKLVKDYGGGSIECSACGPSQVVAFNGWECVSCATAANQPNPSICPSCSSDGEITVERQLDGTSSGTRTCQSCASSTMPDASGTRCVRCNQILSVRPSSSCYCPLSSFTGGVCFSSAADIIDENAELYKIIYSNEDGVNSAYLYENIRAARGMCDKRYANTTACQILGNSCVLTLYRRAGAVCVEHLNVMINDTWANHADWPANMPWLYYLEDTGDQVLSDTRLSTPYTFPDSRLSFKVASYTLNGTFLGIKDVTGGLLQLCKASQNIMDAAYSFGTIFSQECTLNVRDLWDEEKYPMIFYDMYLEFLEGGKKQLYAVPVRILNYKDANGQEVNKGTNRQQWQLVRRFFLVDNIGGREYITSTEPDTLDQTLLSPAREIRYAEQITIHVSLQEGTNDGKIYPPYLTINYRVATRADFDADKKVDVSFDTEYSMNLDKYNRDIAIATGVLSALAVIQAFIQTWGWSKRAGRINLDFVTIIKFVGFSLFSLSNVFFIVAFGSSLWWLIFYKRQTAVYLLMPSADQESTFVACVVVAFVLKAFQLFVLIGVQVTVDIFFIDWERPRGKAAEASKGREAPVSIWRTYFIANEWNEIQTTRKINEILQLFVVILLLNVVGLERWASADPRSDVTLEKDRYYGDHNKFFRFAISGLVYILSAVVQWVFYTFIYERFIEDKIRQYVDLCSMSNVSVFILENARFGYYIHGRSVHGRADTDMREMHENLKREEEDLCGQRGLDPNTEQQTFQVAIPERLRTQYDKVLRQVNVQQQTSRAGAQTGGGAASHIDPQTDQSIQAYGVINKFLQAFVDHSLRDIDYIIKDKLLLESILDMEFQESTDKKGFFYNDDGHSFDSVLFFGHEATLIMFEILLFTVIDLVGKNFILSAVIVFVVMEFLCMARNSLARNNIARKTLVDKRFLI